MHGRDHVCADAFGTGNRWGRFLALQARPVLVQLLRVVQARLVKSPSYIMNILADWLVRLDTVQQRNLPAATLPHVGDPRDARQDFASQNISKRVNLPANYATVGSLANAVHGDATQLAESATMEMRVMVRRRQKPNGWYARSRPGNREVESTAH